LLQKELHFERLAKIQIITTIVEFILFVFLLLQNHKINALLFPFVLKFFIQQFAYLFSERKKIKFANDFISVKSLLKIGNYDLGAQMLNYFYTNLDNILIARFLGESALGFYTLAWDLTVKPVSFFNPVIMRVALPLMSKTDNLCLVYHQTMRQIAAVQVPIYIILALFLKPLIVFFYGEQWLFAADTALILCFVALLRAIAEPGAAVLLVRGRVGVEFYFQIFNTVITFLAIFAFLYFGKNIENVAWATLLAHGIIVPLWLYVVHQSMEKK
jgi:O-antigen/teichoic acid export membrane protein